MQFADWAFGPTGMPNLRILAFGDFSYDERYASQRFLACRTNRELSTYSKTCDFNEANMADPDLWDRVGLDWTYFLSACPQSGLIESPDEW